MLNVQQAGAAGAIVSNNVAGEGAFTMAGGGAGGNATIPAIMVSLEDGARLAEWAAAGNVGS